MRLVWVAALLVSAASALSLRACGQTQRCDAEEIAPRCASDGLTYANDCAFQVARCEDATLRVVGMGVCAHGASEETVAVDDDERCETPCTREFIPLCGSDGVTYANKCTFRNAQRCKYAPGRLWIAKHDAC